MDFYKEDFDNNRKYIQKKQNNIIKAEFSDKKQIRNSKKAKINNTVRQSKKTVSKQNNINKHSHNNGNKTLNLQTNYTSYEEYSKYKTISR